MLIYTFYTPGIYAEGYTVFVFPFVCSFVCSFVLPSVTWNLRQSFALKFLKWCISQQLLIRKHSYLYPRHLCRQVYSFRLSVRPFICSFVRSWNLRQSFALKFLKWCISQQLLIRKHSYLDHSYPGGLAFSP